MLTNFAISNCTARTRPASGSKSDRLLDLIADVIEKAVNLTQEDIEPTPDFGGAINMGS
jgi:hypothetical protein